MARRLPLTTAALLASAALSHAQATAGAPTSQQGYRLELEGLSRQEWTTDWFGDRADQSRWRLRLLPHLVLGSGRLVAGFAGDLNHSSDENTEALAEGEWLSDNYESRSARVDRAYVRFQPNKWLRLEGGRFEMPGGLTEMIWDADLRPQGASASLDLGQLAGRSQLTLSGLWARGSHVFEDEKTTLMMGSVASSVWSGTESKLLMVGSYLVFGGFNEEGALDPRLLRQNSRNDAGGLATEFRVANASVRLVNGGASPSQIFADYCWNTAVESDNRGLWVGLVLGSLVKSRGRFDYAYARVDRDATLGAFAQDDFLWATGWEGHRTELAFNAGDKSTLHVIGQIQRPKDAADPEEAKKWTRRLRIELRFHSAP